MAKEQRHHVDSKTLDLDERFLHDIMFRELDVVSWSNSSAIRQIMHSRELMGYHGDDFNKI